MEYSRLDALQIGGVPVEDLQRAYKGQLRPLVAFPADEDIPMPPTAPATISKVQCSLACMERSKLLSALAAMQV